MNIDKQVKLFLLPFIYFYFLSFGLLAVASYIVLRHPLGATNSYAQTVGNELEPAYQTDINITLSPQNSETKVITTDTVKPDDTTEPLQCNKEIADKIDAYFKSQKAPLAGHGCDFEIHGRQNNIDPILMAAIAMTESTGGKAVRSDSPYNAWGWGMFDSKEATKTAGANVCASWENCIGRVTRGIAKKVASSGTRAIPEDMYLWYNNGRTGWRDHVRGFMNKIEAYATHNNSL